jgi:hypothetical protein
MDTMHVMHMNSMEFGCVQEVPDLHTLDFRTPALMNEILQFHTNHKNQDSWPCHERTCRFLKQALGVQNRLFEQRATIHYSTWIRRSAAGKKFKNIYKNVAVQIALNKFNFFWLTKNRLTNVQTTNISSCEHIDFRIYRLTNTSTCEHIDQKITSICEHINIRTYRQTNTPTWEGMD